MGTDDIQQVPPYVTYANQVGAEVGKAIADQMDKMATKADLRLVEMQVEVERESRKTETRAREALAAELKAFQVAQQAKDDAAEAERKAKGRRVWTAIWSVLGVFIATFGTTVLSLFLNHH